MAAEEYSNSKSFDRYVLQLKYTFPELDKSLRKQKRQAEFVFL
jgi:hypothetical protein